jgi:hypothetical protein
MIYFRNEEEGMEIPEDEEEGTSLADDLLDEVGDDEEDLGEEDEIAGFGHISDDDTKEEEPKGDDEDSDAEELEEDAEDVDYDTFDDVDEM